MSTSGFGSKTNSQHPTLDVEPGAAYERQWVWLQNQKVKIYKTMIYICVNLVSQLLSVHLTNIHLSIELSPHQIVGFRWG